MHAVFHAFVNARIGFGCLSAAAPLGDHPVEDHGTSAPVFFSACLAACWAIRSARSSSEHGWYLLHVDRGLPPSLWSTQTRFGLRSSRSVRACTTRPHQAASFITARSRSLAPA
jgi:hypothetical protein